MVKLYIPAMLAGMMFSAVAQETVKEKGSQQGLKLNGGADVRVRQEIMDNIPNTVTPFLGETDYFRFRYRFWGEAEYENFRLYTRLTDEFWHYNSDSRRVNSWPNELVLDNLYLDANNLFDGWLDLRAGRQDLIYGKGRVILDGTPYDGSRTIYMDAIKATINFDAEKKNTLDLLAIYNSNQSELAIGGLDGGEKELNSIVPGSKYLDEWGGGLYFKSRELDEFPFELYWLYKRETKAERGGVTFQGRKFHTFGARLMPQYTETVSGEFEAAVQTGEKDDGKNTSGYMGYAGLRYDPAVEWKMKPFAKAGVYYLSGDDSRADGNGDSGWNPVWARWPQFSELMVLGNWVNNGAGYWTNLIYPHVEGGFNISKTHKLFASIGSMYAADPDDGGGDDGSHYGYLGTICYDFPILTDVFGREDKRGNLLGRVQAEVLEPGDYYEGDDTAYFIRWQLIAQF
ncbi:MAG: hypothetical protein R6V06_07070 [Kiritimatiellia bacterium]